MIHDEIEMAGGIERAGGGERADESERGGGAARILIVDDEPAILRLITTLLADDGYEVVCATTLAGGLDALATEPAVAVVDKNLPDGSGLTLLRELKRRWPFAEAIVFTGYASFDSVLDALRLGAFDYLTKPLRDLQELRHKVRLGLERRVLLRERERTLRGLDEAHRQQALAAHSEMMAQLGRQFAGIVHEVRSPLAAVRAAVALVQLELKRGAAPTAHTLENLQHALDAVDQIAAVTLEVRRVSGVGGYHPTVRVPTALAQVAESALNLARSEIATRAEVHTAVTGAPMVLGAPVRLTQVVVNLLVNAAQAIPHFGRIDLAVTAVAERARLTVTDDGPGIPPEALSRIFEPFFTTRTERGGTGLGLSLARQIIEEHGGTLTATSPPGAGATFVIDLPAAPATDPGHTEPS